VVASGIGLEDSSNDMATLGNLLGKTVETKTPFDNTLGGILLNTVKGIPQAMAEVVGQPSLRAYAALGGAVTGNPLTPSTPFQKELYGTDKPITLRGLGSEIPGVSKEGAAAPMIGFALSIGDLIPGGSGATKTFSTIAKSENAIEILASLRKFLPKLSEGSLLRASEDLVNVKTENGVKAYLGTLVKAEGTTPSTVKATGEAAAETKSVLQKTEVLPEVSAGQKATSAIPSPEATPTNIRLLGQKGSPTSVPSVTRKSDLLNLERLAVGEKAGEKLIKTLEGIRPELEAIRGAPLSNMEVLKAAQESSILQKGTSRAATLKSEAALLATRQNLAALAEGKGVSKDFIDQLTIIAEESTRRGRELQALGISADAIEASTKADIVKKLLNAGIEAQKIVDASKGVDFNNVEQVTNFYRSFIKATKTEWLDEYRYINLLSSPKTHIVNAFSNLIQGTILNPATRLANGAIDFVLSALTGKEREVYMKEVAPYAKGFINAVPDAMTSFLKALKGDTVLERPDLARIATNSKLLKPLQVIPRMLEASDVLFRTMIKAGETEALTYRYTTQGKKLTQTVVNAIEKKATEKAAYFVFRAPLDPSNKTGQGTVLSAIDNLTTSIYTLRKVPGVKWFVPFVQTPMNILKQGIEYSPLGLTTLPGATNKTEQVAKTLVGSTVFLGAAALGTQGRLTWGIPTGEKEKAAFYNSGRQPYSLKIGNSWVSYSKLGPIAYPLAMAASMQWYLNENPKASTQSSFERATNVMGGIAQFFSDQSYLEGLQNAIEFVGDPTGGAKSAFSSTAGQLIPLSSLQRLVSHVIDPVYRKPKSGFNMTSFVQSLQKDIPFVSKGVPAIKGSLPRQNPLLNAVSPINITDVNPRYERELKNIRRQQKNDARLKAIKERTQK
jgi:hypothetical protein